MCVTGIFQVRRGVCILNRSVAKALGEANEAAFVQ
jgi:hypothetical protein